MRIDLSPIIMDTAMIVFKAGDVLTINGEAYDFTDLPDGATVEDVPCDFIAGPVERGDDGILRIRLILPCNYDAPQERVWPQSIIDPPDGPIAFPGDAS